MNKSKTYRASSVKGVELETVLAGHAGESVEVGLDIGKAWIWAVVRFRNQTYLRPWRVGNPLEIGVLVERLKAMAREVKLTVGMESSGTYGDPLRQALGDAGVNVHRVSSKATHDWAEVFDGVPSQHDGKDAGVVAELCAMGKSVPWRFEPEDQPVQEMRYWVDRLDGAHRVHQLWCGRLESRLARHWPEATARLKISSVTLLRALVKWKDPAALGADPQAAATLGRFSHRLLDEKAIGEMIASARQSVGVRMSIWDRRRMGEDATGALQAHRDKRQAVKHLHELARQHELIPALGKAVGVATACVLWVCVGDPRHYGSGAAYRKAMGLNLAERSSGMWQGKLRISKRGKSMTRRFLYFAAMRFVCRQPQVKQWYLAKKKRDAQEGLRGIVAVMRKLPLAIHAAANGQVFDPSRLFNSIVNDKSLAPSPTRR